MSLATALAAVAFATAAQAQPLPPHNWTTPPHLTLPGVPANRMTYYRGNDLHGLCQQRLDVCTIYIQGVIDGHFAAIIRTSRDLAYCIPVSSTPDQVRDVVVQYLTAHPESRHELAGQLILRALAGAWPQCRTAQ